MSNKLEGEEEIGKEKNLVKRAQAQDLFCGKAQFSGNNKAFYCFMCVNNQSLVRELAHAIYIHPFSKALQLEKNTDIFVLSSESVSF